MQQKRIQKFKDVVSKRQPSITVILENVHDQHNIGAVMRTCDSIGIMEIFVLQSNPKYSASNITLGKRTSAGTRKWVDVHFYTNLEQCFAHVRSKYEHIYATHLDTDSKSLYDLDLASSVALLFGNEAFGVSEEALKNCDGNFIIPQMGFVQSLNISVACAVSLYEAYRQRDVKGMYDKNAPLEQAQQEALYEDYLERHKAQVNNQTVFSSDQPVNS